MTDHLPPQPPQDKGEAPRRVALTWEIVKSYVSQPESELREDMGLALSKCLSVQLWRASLVHQRCLAVHPKWPLYLLASATGKCS